jgi:hypothetical protein
MINMVNQLLSLLKYADIDTMNSKATMTFSTLTIAPVALLFASGPIAGKQQALRPLMILNTVEEVEI